jgi:hypothetical protein
MAAQIEGTGAEIKRAADRLGAPRSSNCRKCLSFHPLTAEQKRNISLNPGANTAFGLWAVDNLGDKAVANALSTLFFFGLLVSLAVILEITLRAHWAAVCAALRGPGPVPAPLEQAPLLPRGAAV